jgi:hypothetical protein
VPTSRVSTLDVRLRFECLDTFGPQVADEEFEETNTHGFHNSVGGSKEERQGSELQYVLVTALFWGLSIRPFSCKDLRRLSLPSGANSGTLERITDCNA